MAEMTCAEWLDEWRQRIAATDREDSAYEEWMSTWGKRVLLGEPLLPTEREHAREITESLRNAKEDERKAARAFLACMGG